MVVSGTYVRYRGQGRRSPLKGSTDGAAPHPSADGPSPQRDARGLQVPAILRYSIAIPFGLRPISAPKNIGARVEDAHAKVDISSAAARVPRVSRVGTRQPSPAP